MWWELETLDNFNSFTVRGLGPMQICKPNLLLNSNQVYLHITSKFNLGKFQIMYKFAPFADPSIIWIKFYFSAVKTNYLETLLLWFQLIEIFSAQWLPGPCLPERSPMWEIETIETLPANLHTRLTSHIIIMSRTLFTLPFNGGGKLWSLFFLLSLSLSLSPDLCGKFWCFPVWCQHGRMAAVQHHDIIFMSRIEYSHPTRQSTRPLFSQSLLWWLPWHPH